MTERHSRSCAVNLPIQPHDGDPGLEALGMGFRDNGRHRRPPRAGRFAQPNVPQAQRCHRCRGSVTPEREGPAGPLDLQARLQALVVAPALLGAASRPGRGWTASARASTRLPGVRRTLSNSLRASAPAGPGGWRLRRPSAIAGRAARSRVIVRGFATTSERTSAHGARKAIAHPEDEGSIAGRHGFVLPGSTSRVRTIRKSEPWTPKRGCQP